METFPHFESHKKSPQGLGLGVHLVIDRVGSRTILRGAYTLTASELNTLPDPSDPLASCVINVRSLRLKKGVTLPATNGQAFNPQPPQKFTNESVRKGGFFNIDLTDTVRELGGTVEVNASIGLVKARPVTLEQ